MSDEPPRLSDRLWQQREERRAAERAAAARQPAQEAARAEHAANACSADRRSKYAQRALDLELTSVERAQEGERNDALNRAAYSLGQLIAAGALDELPTREALAGAALRAGLTQSETRATIESGISKGKQQPRELTLTQLVARDDSSDAAHPFGRVDSSGQPPIEPPTQQELDDFWSARPLLKHVELFARSRVVAPWAVLGVVLARIVAATPKTIVLPPIVGSHASLNLFVGLVGPSGSGKGAAERVAAECLRLGQALTILTTGSGEGIAHGYVKREKGEIVEHNKEMSVLFTVPEIDTLSALGARQGATLMPELRRAWSGEQLGFQYVDPQKRLIVAAHGYRMTLVAGIQPARAATLLDDSDGGTPQRFIWCSAIDRDAPDELPETPAPLTWERPSWHSMTTRSAFGTGLNQMHVCDIARQTIIDARQARNRGDGDALDGHALLARLKTAAALSIADGRCDVSEDDWELAGVVMRQSDATRESVRQTLSRAEREKNVTRAEAEADRSIIVEERSIDASMRRAGKAIMRKLRRTEGEWVARSDVRRAVAHRDRGAADPAIESLLSAGQIEQRDVEHNGQTGHELRVP
jgi:hypothetical protein